MSVRACARPLSADGRPLLGRAPGRDDLYVAAGHGPWGISLGPASARLVADLVLGRATAPLAAFDPARFAARRPSAVPQRGVTVDTGVEAEGGATCRGRTVST